MKKYVLEYVDGVWKLRVPVPPTASKYDPNQHFQWFESSDYLDFILGSIPYATFTTDDRDEMENLLMNGYKDRNGRIWREFFAYWKDQEGHAFLVPEDSGIKSLSDVGVHTFMKSPGDFMKVGKYVNRLFAALPKDLSSIDTDFGIWGKEIPDSFNPADNVCLVLLDERKGDAQSEDDRTLAVRYVDLDTLEPEQKALVDGAILVSEKAVRALKLSKEPRIGMAWRGTFGTERGLGKGHILYKSDLSVDVVIYGPKKIVRTDRFFFGSMGELHAGIPHTDRQAFINFHMHRPQMGPALAKYYMRSVIAASKDEAALRRLFLRYTEDQTHTSMDEEAWVLRRALAYGVSFLRHPGLFRRVVRYLMTKVMQCDIRARIPMDSVAHYGYVLPDPNAITSDGDVDLSKAIPEGTIVFPDLKPGTQVVCYRQPSENTNAWVSLKVVSKPEFKKFAGRGICLLGRGAMQTLGRLGGGDMDDQFVIVHDPAWVEAFHTMRPYPETEKLSAEVTEEEQEEFDRESTELSEFTEELLEDIRDRNMTQYTAKHVSWQIELAKNARAGIGPVVNYGMMDMLLSDPDHRASMLADLKSRDPEAVEWLEGYEPYQAALMMTNLEIVIDGNVKDQTLLRKLGDVSGTIKQFHKDCHVYPSSMVPARIPASKLEKGDYTTARSLTCRALEQITHLRNTLNDIFIQREWALVAPADRDLRAEYPHEREISARVRGRWRHIGGEWQRMDPENMSLMDIWAQEWRDRLDLPEGDPDRVNAYKEICELISAEVEGEDDETMESLAAEIYYQTYKQYQSQPKVDEVTGAYRNYNDGLLWSPVFANHFINALRKARLAGFYTTVVLFPWFRGRVLDKSMAVQIKNRQVYIQDADDLFTVLVGWIPGKNKAPDGTFRMDSGLIEIRQPKEICQPADPMLMAQKPLTRVFPSVKTPEVPVEEEKPSNTFAKLLDAASSILGFKKEDKQ